MKETADIGLIGLAVMGQNLALNMSDHGYRVAVYNRTTAKMNDFVKKWGAKCLISGFEDIKALVESLKRPRKVMLMIKAGSSVDKVIDELTPFLERGDILIDGGNSHYTDSERRYHALDKKGIFFIGAGISGGEEGARHGPSIMPGGHLHAWPEIKPIFQAIAAQSEEKEPCCHFVGTGGAGHYVKMVHNGIEYGDMQIICESYDLLSRLLKLKADDLSIIFSDWNQGELSSYLIEITSQIFAFKTKEGRPLVEEILDVAGQKGTGRWTVMSALERSMPVTLIGEAVFARCLSSLKEERLALSQHFKDSSNRFRGDKKQTIEEIRQALYASKIMSYAQGFMLMRAAAAEMNWTLNYGSIALMWRGGCIIRSRFLEEIKKAFEKNPDLTTLIMDDFFKKEIVKAEKPWRRVIGYAAEFGVPIPCLSSSLAFFDGYRSSRLPANLMQAQRDFFGAHTYERLDSPRNTFFHTNWTGEGGEASSTSYNA